MPVANAFNMFQGAIYFAPMNKLFVASILISFALCIVFTLIQILKAWRRKSFIGYIGCSRGLHIVMVAPLISYIRRDKYGGLIDMHYSFGAVLDITLVSSIPIAILLGVTVISNLRHRNKTSHEM